VVFPRAGVFVKHTGNDKAVADPNHVLFFNANEPYRVSHPVSGGDDCTSFVFSTEALVEVLSLHEPTVRDHPQKPFRFTHGPIELQTIFRQQQLRRNLSDDSTRALEIEESALHLLHEVTRHVYHHRGAPLRRHRPDTLRLRRHWVESVKLLIAERPAANLSLAEIACAVHCSPFHLARLFRTFAGSSIHKYQLHLRMALALERLDEIPGSLTDLAFDLGFSSHSHFTAAFQRCFSISPSAFRRAATGSRVRELSKILKV